MTYIIQITAKLLPFLWVTIFLAITSMLLGLFFGSILAAMKLKGRVSAKIANGYTTVIRSTPVVILLFLSYYGLPLLLEPLGMDIGNADKRLFTILALTMYSSAILSEIIRPAYLAVNQGQLEAALSVGLTFGQALRHIILPQMFYIALPNFGNMMISLIHESALAYLIGVIDIMGQAKVINSMSYGANVIKIYFGVSILYWFLSIVTGKAVDTITARMGKYLNV